MFDGRDPIYLQIADRIRDDVLSGALGEEEQVMSTTQYATTYRINPATAAKAFTQLVDQGVVYKRRGVGIFVSPGARERLLAERRRSFFADVVEPVAAGDLDRSTGWVAVEHQERFFRKDLGCGFGVIFCNRPMGEPAMPRVGEG